jgi:3-methyladenine DNA glycosylase Mpg
VDLTRGPLWLSDLPPQRFGCAMRAGPRIGIRQGVERRWRFWLEGHSCVSGPRGRGGVRATPLRQFTVDTPAGRS